MLRGVMIHVSHFSLVSVCFSVSLLTLLITHLASLSLIWFLSLSLTLPSVIWHCPSPVSVSIRTCFSHLLTDSHFSPAKLHIDLILCLSYLDVLTSICYKLANRIHWHTGPAYSVASATSFTCWHAHFSLRSLIHFELTWFWSCSQSLPVCLYFALRFSQPDLTNYLQSLCSLIIISKVCHSIFVCSLPR